jgi:hypothetical protein
MPTRGAAALHRDCSAPSRMALTAGVTLASVVLLATARVITFTGDAEADFVKDADGVFVFADDFGPGVDVIVAAGLTQTGWDLKDVRFAYDLGTDTAFFGKPFQAAAAASGCRRKGGLAASRRRRWQCDGSFLLFLVGCRHKQRPCVYLWGRGLRRKRFFHWCHSAKPYWAY